MEKDTKTVRQKDTHREEKERKKETVQKYYGEF